MDKKYLEYNWEQLLEEDNFISWLRRKDNAREWELFLKEHPVFEKEAAKARKIYNLLKDEYDIIDENTRQELLGNIREYERRNSNKTKVFHLSGALGWAASIILILAIGTLAVFFWQGHEKDYQFASAFIADEAYLLLSDGNKIALSQENPKIVIDKTGKRILANDTAVDIADPTPGNSNKRMIEAIIPPGSRAELVLADGTEVWLNSGSKLAFPVRFSKKERKVYLEGEAYFQVEPDAEHPYVVDAGDMDVRVLGTHFNVSAYPEERTIETVLVEGSVAVRHTGRFIWEKEEIVLKPNQKAEYGKAEESFSVYDEDDVQMYIAWTNGWLNYKQESLASVLRKVERYYNIKIELPEDYPGDDKITGKLDLKNSIETVMQILADASGFKYTIEKDRVIIRKGTAEQKIN